MDFQFSFDRSQAFRRSPWLYAMLVFLFLGIAALAVGMIFYPLWTGRPEPRTTNPLVNETSQDKSDRLVIMNVLNRFQLEESALPPSSSAEERLAKRQEHLTGAINRLKSVETTGTYVHSAQNDLLGIFNRWNNAISFNEDTSTFRAEFIALAEKYPWMKDLVWLTFTGRL